MEVRKVGFLRVSRNDELSGGQSNPGRGNPGNSMVELPSLAEEGVEE
jgi:hypothetical protein